MPEIPVHVVMFLVIPLIVRSVGQFLTVLVALFAKDQQRGNRSLKVLDRLTKKR